MYVRCFMAEGTCYCACRHIRINSLNSHPLSGPIFVSWFAYLDVVKITCASHKYTCMHQKDQRVRWYLLSSKYVPNQNSSPQELVSVHEDLYGQQTLLSLQPLR